MTNTVKINNCAKQKRRLPGLYNKQHSQCIFKTFVRIQGKSEYMLMIKKLDHLVLLLLLP